MVCDTAVCDFSPYRAIERTLFLSKKLQMFENFKNVRFFVAQRFTYFFAFSHFCEVDTFDISRFEEPNLGDKMRFCNPIFSSIPPDCHHPTRSRHRCHFGLCPPCDQTCNFKLPKCKHVCPSKCHSAVRRRVQEKVCIIYRFFFFFSSIYRFQILEVDLQSDSTCIRRYIDNNVDLNSLIS